MIFTENKGQFGELVAEQYLIENGYRILEKNFKGGLRGCELDLIATFEDYLIFFEVKYRSTNSFGFPEEAVNNKKKVQIKTAINHYLNFSDNHNHTKIRFDILSITGGFDFGQPIIKHFKDVHLL
jgi:putative endonuclease